MEQMAASKMFQSAVSFPQGRLLQVGFFFGKLNSFSWNFGKVNGMWKLQCGQWGNESTDNLFTGVSFLRLSWFVCLYFDFWFWSIILIGCCEHPSFIHNTKWKTAVRNLVSMAWHDLHDGFRLRHRNIYHTWISRFFFTVEVLYYG